MQGTGEILTLYKQAKILELEDKKEEIQEALDLNLMEQDYIPMAKLELKMVNQNIEFLKTQQ